MLLKAVYQGKFMALKLIKILLKIKKLFITMALQSPLRNYKNNLKIKPRMSKRKENNKVWRVY